MPYAEEKPDVIRDRAPDAATILTPGIVHDLGNLIQVAASAVNIVSAYPKVESEPALAEAVSGAKVSLQRAGALVRETMQLARGHAATVESVNVAECLEQIGAFFGSVGGAGVSLDLRVDAALPAVKCSRLGLENAIVNLVYNARDAMPGGGVVSILASCPLKEGEAEEIVLRVVDRGVGMTSATIARAMEPFFTTKATGLGGLGLPMVRRFVQETHGTIAFESEVGVGTTVTLRLPV